MTHMQLRFGAALTLFSEGCTLEVAAGALVAAIKEAKEYGCDPNVDAAVLVLGQQIMFLTHADAMHAGGVSQLLDNCALYHVPHELTVKGAH